MQRIKLVRKNGEDIAGVLSDKLRDLTTEFEEYKVKNNIDTYFSKFVDRQSGARVLKDIQDFLKRKSEEDDELPFNYQRLLEELKFSGSTTALDEVQ